MPEIDPAAQFGRILAMKSLLSALAAATLFAFVAGPGAAQGRPAAVLVDQVTEKSISETVAVFGEVVASRESRVAARISGVADSISVEIGDRVAEGDVLAEIDGELLSLEVARAEAELAVAKAAAATAQTAVDNAQTAYARAETLRANSVIADAAYEDRESALSAARGAQGEAEARVAAARVALRRAQYDLDNAVVRAPFDGVVIELGTEIGQFVTQGSEVARLIDTTNMEVEAAVPARFVGALRADADVAAVTDAGGEMVLRLRAALPTEYSSTRTRPVIFEVVSTAEAPAAGQSVTLDVPVSAPRTVAAVPKDALIQSRGGWQVFLAQDGKAQPRTVEIGAPIGDRYEVVSGLVPGDEVVVRGNERLRPGQDISAMASDVESSGGPPAAPEEEIEGTATGASDSIGDGAARQQAAATPAGD